MLSAFTPNIAEEIYLTGKWIFISPYPDSGMSTAEGLAGRTVFNAENVASGTVWLTRVQASNYVIGLLFYFFIARLLSKARTFEFSLLLLCAH